MAFDLDPTGKVGEKEEYLQEKKKKNTKKKKKWERTEKAEVFEEKSGARAKDKQQEVERKNFFLKGN